MASMGNRRAVRQASKWADEMRQARIGQNMTIQQAAHRAGIGWATYARLEAGDPHARLMTMCAAGEAIGLDLVLQAYPGRPPSLRDTGQLELANWLCGQAHPSWQPAVELLVGDHGESIDTAFFGASEILANEIERMAADFQGQYRRADRKREILAAQHQRPVRLILTIEDTRRNRAAIEPHLAFIRTVLPAGSREVLRALRTGQPLGRDGLLWVRRPRSS